MTTLPHELTAAQKNALRLAAETTLVRRTHGWNAAGAGRRVSKDVGTALIAMGLARQDTSHMHPRLVATGAGRDLWHVIQLRAERRARRGEKRTAAGRPGDNDLSTGATNARSHSGGQAR